MKNKIHLKSIEGCLEKTLVELDYDFLCELVYKLSKLQDPSKDRVLAQKLGWKYNNKIKRSMGLKCLLYRNRAIAFPTLRRLVILSKTSWFCVEKHIISVRLGRSAGKIYLKFPLYIDYMTGRIIGHILGDGSIDQKYLQVFFTNKSRDLIIDFAEAMESLFGIKPRIWLQKSGNFIRESKWIKRIPSLEDIKDNQQIGLFYPSICGLILNFVCDNFAIGKRKRITKKILDSPYEFKIGLISAFFDDEGSVDLFRSLRFYNDNIQLLRSLKILLTCAEVESKSIRRYMRRNKERYYFNVCSYHNIRKFYERIDIMSPEKKQKMIEYLNHCESGKKSKSLISKYNLSITGI